MIWYDNIIKPCVCPILYENKIEFWFIFRRMLWRHCLGPGSDQLTCFACGDVDSPAQGYILRIFSGTSAVKPGHFVQLFRFYRSIQFVDVSDRNEACETSYSEWSFDSCPEWQLPSHISLKAEVWTGLAIDGHSRISLRFETPGVNWLFSPLDLVMVNYPNNLKFTFLEAKLNKSRDRFFSTRHMYRNSTCSRRNKNN